MSDKKTTNLGEYFIAAFLGGILTGPGGLFLSTLILFLISRSKREINHKSKWSLWGIVGILPFIITFYGSFVLSRTDTYTKELKKALNDQALKCKASDFESEGGPKLILVNSLYKTYIPEYQTECLVYKAQPRNFKSGLRSILFWNRNFDATWFQIELNQTTGEVQKICGDSSKTGCNEGNTW
tara:strand:- start:77 stop:625 length:549 start_codon:yes stop_codon:yes gene_type:complete